MSLQKQTVKQCCVCTPIWIFVYEDGSIFSICEKDFKSPSYRMNVVEVINIESRQSFTPLQAFGGPKIGKL